MTGLRPITAFECPADGCDWTITTEEIELRKMADGPQFRARITYRDDGSPLLDFTDSLVAEAKFTDGILREHLETHDVIDWVKTIVNRDQQIYKLQDTGVRPHVYGSQWEIDRG